MSDITVKELRLARKQLELDIIALVEQFEMHSGTRVEGTRVNRFSDHTMGLPAIESRLSGINITTSI